jgi:hypothetical protein
MDMITANIEYALPTHCCRIALQHLPVRLRAVLITKHLVMDVKVAIPLEVAFVHN